MIAIIVAPIAARAEIACEENHKLADCWKANDDAASALVAEEAKRGFVSGRFQDHFNRELGDQLDEARSKLLAEPVGEAVGVAQTATQNLLPRFSIAGLGVGDGVDSNALRGDWNFGLLSKEAHESKLRAAAVPKPKLAQPVLDALAGAASSVVENLKDKLGPDDDYSFEYTWSLRGWGFGRDIELYRDKQASLLAAAFPAPPPARGQWQWKFKHDCVNDEKGQKPDGVPKDIFELTPAAARQLDAFQKHQEACAALLAEFPGAAWAAVERLKAFRDKLEAAQLDRFADLVNNQPQLTVNVTHRQLDPLVGASYTAARLSVETGWANLDFFEWGPGKECFVAHADDYARGQDDAIADARCLSAFSRYMKRNEDELDAKNRVAAWIEYARLRDLRVDVPEADVHLAIPGGNRLSAGITLGRVLLGEGELGSTRVDASARMEHFTNDQVRLDRRVYSVVLTQRIGFLNVPLVLAYSDHSEFEGGPKGLTTTLGLGFDFGPIAKATTLPEIDVTTPLRVVAPER
ncbi:MAG TPA: hypothetical protein VFB36_13845 [Nevskiaceae bacterium]|nr:hypothetical protein [Nevskiaceae bacterium]